MTLREEPRAVLSPGVVILELNLLATRPPNQQQLLGIENAFVCTRLD